MSRKPRSENHVAHLEAQIVRLTSASATEDSLFRATAALREVHAIVTERSSNRTAEERIALARQHLVSALAALGCFIPPAKYQRGKPTGAYSSSTHVGEIDG